MTLPKRRARRPHIMFTSVSDPVTSEAALYYDYALHGRRFFSLVTVRV